MATSTGTHTNIPVQREKGSDNQVAVQSTHQPQTFTDMQDAMESEMEQRRTKWEKEVEKMQEDFFQLKTPSDQKALTEGGEGTTEKSEESLAGESIAPSQRPGRAVGTEIIDISNTKNIYKEMPDGSKLYCLRFDVRGFEPGEICVRAEGKKLLVYAKHEDSNGRTKRQFNRQMDIPDEVDADSLVADLSSDGILCVEAPVDESKISQESINARHQVLANPKVSVETEERVLSSNPPPKMLHTTQEGTRVRPEIRAYEHREREIYPEAGEMFEGDMSEMGYPEMYTRSFVSPDSRQHREVRVTRSHTGTPGHSYHTEISRSGSPGLSYHREIKRSSSPVGPGYSYHREVTHSGGTPVTVQRKEVIDTHPRGKRDVIIQPRRLHVVNTPETYIAPTFHREVHTHGRPGGISYTSPNGGYHRQVHYSSSTGGIPTYHSPEGSYHREVHYSSGDDSGIPDVLDPNFPKIIEARTPSESTATTSSSRLSLGRYSSPLMVIVDGQRKMKLAVDIGTGYAPEDVTVKLSGNKLALSATHEEATPSGRKSQREFSREFDLPEPIRDSTLRAMLSEDGKVMIGASGRDNKNHTAVLRSIENDMPEGSKPCNIEI